MPLSTSRHVGGIQALYTGSMLPSCLRQASVLGVRGRNGEEEEGCAVDWTTQSLREGWKNGAAVREGRSYVGLSMRASGLEMKLGGFDFRGLYTNAICRPENLSHPIYLRPRSFPIFEQDRKTHEML